MLPFNDKTNYFTREFCQSKIHQNIIYAAKGGGMEINMSAIKINKENFEQIKNSDKPVLLDFYADWCGPCRMVLPIIDEIAGERDDIVVGKINVDAESELAEQFGVFSIPTLVVLKDGKVVNQASGARPKAQILALLNG